MSKADGADLQDLARLRLGPVTAIFALMVTTQAALDELNLSGATVTEAQRALRSCGIETSNADERLRSESSPRRFNRRGSRLVSLGL